MPITWSTFPRTCFVAAVVVVVSATLAAARPDPGRPSAGLPPYVYFFGCLGTYLQLETTTHEVRARGTIWDAPSAAVIRPDAVTTADGCLLNQGEYDRHTGVLYVVLSQESRLDPEGRRQYRIAVLQLPHFTLMTKRDINVALEEPPRIALSPDGSTLLVNFTFQEDSPQGETERDVLLRYQGPALQQDVPPQEVRRLSAQQAITHGLYLSKRAYWGRQGHIVDENLLLDEHGNVLRRVDGYALLTDTIKGTFRSLERLEGPQKQALDISFADSAAGRILFALGWDMMLRRARRTSHLLGVNAGRSCLPRHHACATGHIKHMLGQLHGRHLYRSSPLCDPVPMLLPEPTDNIPWAINNDGKETSNITAQHADMDDESHNTVITQKPFPMNVHTCGLAAHERSSGAKTPHPPYAQSWRTVRFLRRL